MSHPLSPKTQNIAFDHVVIRFTRQIYYENEHVFQLEVRQSPGPLPGGAFQANVEAQLGQFRQIFIQRVTMNQFFYRYETPPPEFGSGQDLADLGTQLYELLPQSFRQTFPRLIQNIFEKGRGLRLVLEARAGDKADRLLSLPWEILFFRETQIYLARSPRVLIIRRLLDAVRRSPIQMEPPFNVIHVIAHNPTGPEKYWIDENLQQTERDAIHQAIAPGHYEPVQNPGSVEQMLAALREQLYHIVHFLGHGETYKDDEIKVTQIDTKRGYLRFISADGNTQWVTGEQLQHLLGFTPTVQLVILNACHGGASVAGNIALELVYSGLPYVVAMQSDILQDAAKYFIQAFYTELQRGWSIDYAVAVGRSTIVANMPGTIDWCLPVLYTNAGLPEKPTVVEAADNLWHWVSQPAAQKRLGIANIMLGVLHAAVGLLLLLSHASPALPGALFMNWVTGGLVAAPLLLTAGAYLLGQPSTPRDWSLSNRAALLARLLGAASLGLGLPTLYSWFLLILLASLGFWEVLSPVAQPVLLCLLFIPGILFSYSQLIGQGQAFVTNAHIEASVFQWSELVFTIAGYGMLLLPWIIMRFGAGLLSPPWGNFILSMLLLAVGYFLYKDTTEV